MKKEKKINKQIFQKIFCLPRTSVFSSKRTYPSRMKRLIIYISNLSPDSHFYFPYCEAADFRLTDRTLSNHHITRRKFILSVYPPSGRMRQGSYRKMRFFLQSPNRRPRQTFPRASASLVFVHVYMSVDCFNSKASAAIPRDAFPMTAVCRHLQG